MTLHQRYAKRLLLAVVMVCMLTVFGTVDARYYTNIERVSLASPNLQTDKGGQRPAVNFNGTRVAFWSDSSIMVNGDNNNFGDIFVRDTAADTTVRVSVGPSGVQSNQPSFAELDIDNGGNLIVFSSNATNLVNGDTNGFTDIFVYDNGVAKATARVSIGAGGVQGNAPSYRPVISGNGLMVAFRSNANNLVPNDTNNQPDVFLYDRVVNAIARVNLANDGSQSNTEDANANIALNFDGKYVGFDTRANNIVSGDSNGVSDVFVRNRVPNTTVRISVSTSGAQANGASYFPALSANGRFVAFESTASNLVVNDTNARTDIFLRDRDTDNDGVFDEAGKVSTILVTKAFNGNPTNNNSSSPSISDDGRFISFWSLASNLVSGDKNGKADIFIYDRITGVITRVGGTVQPNGLSAPLSSISGDGNYVAFQSEASNLVSNPTDTNGTSDVFIARGGPSAPTQLVATAASFTEIDLTWKDNSNSGDPQGNAETKFVVQRSTYNKNTSQWGTWATIAGNVAANTTSFTDSTAAVTQCTTHRYRVAAQNAVNMSPYSNVATVSTQGCPPGAFTLLTPISGEAVVNPANVTVFTWSSASEAVTYTYVLTDTTAASTVTTLTPNAVDICDTTTLVCTLTIDSTVQSQLVDGHTYSWTVSATNTIGTTNASNNPFTFTINTSLPPRVFKLNSPLKNRVTRTTAEAIFKWQQNPDAETYDFFLFKLSDDPTRALGLVSELTDLTPATDSDILSCTSTVCTLTADATLLNALSDGLFSWTAKAVSPGGTPTEASNGPVTFSINTGDIELLTNGGFEININPVDTIPDGWKAANLTKDGVRCAALNAFEGNCFVQFLGATGENSSLTQIPAFGKYSLDTGDTLALSAYFRGTNMVTGARVQLTVTYVDTALTPSKITLNAGTGTYAYTQKANSIILDGPVAKINVVMSSTAKAGTLRVDNVSLLIKAGGNGGWSFIPSRRNNNTNNVLPPTNDGWIPLPPQP